MQRHMELRKLPAASLTNIANILEINDDWEKVVTLIPKDLTSEKFERKYNKEQIMLMAQHAKETKQRYADVLFEEWGTSGRVRPTIDTLMKILQEAQILRAVDEIAHMIGEPPPPRPENGPGAPITTSFSKIQDDEYMEEQLDSIKTVNSSNLYNSSHVRCNRTTLQLKRVSDMIKFPPSDSMSTAGENNVRYHWESVDEKKEVSDLMRFPKSESNLPDISRLLNEPTDSIPTKSTNTGSSSSETFGTSTEDELSVFTPNVSKYFSSSKSTMDIFGIIDKAILDDKKLVPFEYKELEIMTNKFSETFSEKPTGPVGKIGSGGFGDVYVGTHKTHGALAVKRVRSLIQISCELDTAIKIFNTEVKSLSHLRHENIVPIFGYSIDGPTPCIVCKYIDGGSLQQKLAAKVLTEQQRMDIIQGTAEGLRHIHHTEKPLLSHEILDVVDPLSSKKSYYLHGDVKSANILLTKDCVPKLCDFGLVKQLDTTLITRSIMGTLAYMAPEGVTGTITQKNDIYSFGIVLLEIITGLCPIVTMGAEQINIKSYVKETCPDGNITKVLDRVVPKWTKAQKIYELAKHCLELDKDDRPTINEVCNILYDIDKKQ